MSDPSFTSIVHVTEKGGSFGGTEEYISLLTAELSHRGVRSSIICGGVGGALPDGLKSDAVVVDGLASRDHSPQTAPEVGKALDAIDADVIYLHNLFDADVVEVATGRGVPVIWYVHDHFTTCLSELRWQSDGSSCDVRLGEGCLSSIQAGCCVMRYPQRAYDLETLRRRQGLSEAMQSVDAIIVVSDYMRRLLVEAEPLVAGRVHVLPRPIRQVGATEVQKAPRRDPSDPAIVTVAGRVTPEKGIDVAIEAATNVSSRVPIEFWVAGVVENSDYWQACLDKAARATTATPHITFRTPGHLDYAGTDALLRRSHIVAVPSLWPEPFGAVALEALSAGAAVVASHVGGLDTCIVDGQNGLLVPPGHAAAWTGAFDRLLANPDLSARLGENGRSTARRYTIEDHVRALKGLTRVHTRVG